MPSEKVLEQKKAVVAALSERIANSCAGVLVKYQGIKVDEDTKLRAELRNAGVEYTVVKDTLIGRACEQNGLDEMKKHLEGMTAIATSANDPIVAAKILKGYADKLESFEIKAGYLDGKYVTADTVNELAEIPSKEVLIGKFLGSIQGPLYGFAYAIQAIIDKSGEAPAEAAEAPAEA